MIESSARPPKSARPRRCLVTGGAGFIGSHVVDALLAVGHEVAVLDNLSGGSREHVPAGVPFFLADIRENTSEAFRVFRPQVVLHHAAQVSVTVSAREPEDDAHINVLGSIRLIRTALEHGVEKIIYPSSAAAYGPQDSLPLHEGMRATPISAYGASKYTVEHYLKTAKESWGLEEWVALRYSNVYGPRQSAHGEAGVVAIFCREIRSGRSPSIFDDGELTRDYIYVSDVAAANVAALDTDLRAHPDSVFNVSTGRETTTNRVFEVLRGAFGAAIEPTYAPARAGDVRRSVLDSRRAAKDLGWSAVVGLEEGLGATAAYFARRSDSENR